MKSFFTFAHTCRHLSRVLLVITCLVGGGIFAWAQKELPYSYGFENNNLAAEGWTIVDGQTNSSQTTGIMNNGYAHNYNKETSKYVFRFYGNTSAAQFLVSPELNSSETGIKVTLYWSALLSYGSGTRSFTIGHSTTTNDVKGDNVFTWENPTSGSVTTDKAWYMQSYTFPVGTKFIAIKYAANVHIYFDDIEIKAQSSYLPPTDFTTSSVNYNQAALTWTKGSDETNWQIKYNAGTNFDPDEAGTMVSDNPVTTKPYTLSNLSECTTYYAYIRSYIDADTQSDWSSVLTFTTPEQYPIPTSLECTAFTGSTATLSWSNGIGATPTTWQLRYSTLSTFVPSNEEGFLVENITANPYTLSGLTTGTTYYASIRADYGDDNYSEWTEKVSFTPRAEVETTINDGSGTSSYVPIYGSGANSTSNASQFILPSSQLSGVSGRQITKIVLHTTSTYASRNWGKAEWEVYMNEVAVTSFSTQTLMAFGTKVFNAATLSVSNQELSITLDTPFNYNGGNLLIGFKTTKADASNWCTFYGVTASSGTNNGLYGTSSLSYQSFYPKMTITSVPITTEPVQMGTNGYTTFASPRALNLSNLPSGLKAYKAQVVNDRVKFTEIDQAVPANTGILLEGTEETTYFIPVAASGTAPDGNEFLVNSTGGTFTADANSTYYGLVKATTAEEVPVFGTFDPASVAIPSNKAYLKVSSEATARLTCWFDSETTGIGEAQRTISDGGATTVFDLQGRRVAVGDGSAERTQLPKGVYIVNGRKVVVK